LFHVAFYFDSFVYLLKKIEDTMMMMKKIADSPENNNCYY
jgi:hypothetical protein